MKMLDFKVKRFVGIIFHLILAQICLAQTGIANQNFGKDTLQLREVVVRARIQQASAKLRNVFVKALLWC